MNVLFFFTKLGAGEFVNCPENHLVVTMRDGSTFDGTLVKRPELQVPFWMYHNGMRALHYFVFVRLADHHFTSMLNKQHVLPDHDPAQHGPTSVKINIKDCLFYSTNFFQVYNVKEHDHRSANDTFHGNFPLNYHIYLAVPENYVYSAALQHHP